ncbi:MAG: hypothetical protein ABSB95_11085, partial [Dissulfurispiraceae bacterium]
MKHINVFLAASLLCLIFPLPVFSASGNNIDKDYIKEHYPDVYMQIYTEGKQEGLHEVETKAATKPAAEVQKTEPEQAAASKKAVELGDWWNHSALKYEPMPAGYLLHMEGQYNFTSVGGNNRGLVYRGNGQIVVRKDRFTDNVAYVIDERRISQPSSDQTTYKNYQFFQESLDYDIYRKFYAEGGFIWEKDKTSLINNRDIYYGGLGYHA